MSGMSVATSHMGSPKKGEMRRASVSVNKREFMTRYQKTDHFFNYYSSQTFGKHIERNNEKTKKREFPPKLEDFIN